MRIWLLLAVFLMTLVPGCGSDSSSVSGPSGGPSPAASGLVSPGAGPSPAASSTPFASPSPGTLASPSPVAPPLATLTVQLVLEQLRIVQAYVQTVRLSGLDAGGRRIYGPVERPKQATLIYTDIPSNVVELQLDLLIGPAGNQTVTGIFRGPINLTSGAATLTDPNFIDVATVQSLAVTGASSLARGSQTQLVCRGTFTDGANYDLTTAVRWASSASTVATVSPTGLVNALAPGTTSITASRDALASSLNVTVTPATLASLAVSPASAALATFSTQAFTTLGTFSDNTTQDLTTQVSWTSSNSGVATISPTGLASTVGPGSAVISARQGSVTGNATLAVSGPSLVNATILPQNPRVPLFAYQSFALNATLSDGSVRNLTALAEWTSSEPSIAAVTLPGEIRALNRGVAVLTATLGATRAQTNVTAVDQATGGGGGGQAGPRFAAAVSFPLGTSPRQLIVGDFNADLRPDVATANPGGDGVVVLLNTGGAFGAPTTFAAAVGSGPFGLAAGLLNAGGALDIVTADETLSTASVLLGNGAGGFGAATAFSTGAASTPRGVLIGDFNGAGGLDVASANAGSGTGTNGMSVLAGDGAGNLGAPTQFDTAPIPFGLASGLFNGDAFLDLAVSCSSGTTTVRFGNGAGAFPTFTNVTVGAGASRVLASDLNGDGSLDFATANFTANSISLVYGNGAGGFAAAINLLVGMGPREVAAGDFTGDGLLDLAVANVNASSVSILAGNGAGSYTPAATLAVAVGPTSIVAADFNGDGRVDLATANAVSNNVSLLLQLP